MFDELLVGLEDSPAAKFIVPELGDEIDSGIGLSYGLPAMWPGGPVQHLYVGVNFILPVMEHEFGHRSLNVLVRVCEDKYDGF